MAARFLFRLLLDNVVPAALEAIPLILEDPDYLVLLRLLTGSYEATMNLFVGSLVIEIQFYTVDGKDKFMEAFVDTFEERILHILSERKITFDSKTRSLLEVPTKTIDDESDAVSPQSGSIDPVEISRELAGVGIPVPPEGIVGGSASPENTNPSDGGPPSIDPQNGAIASTSVSPPETQPAPPSELTASVSGTDPTSPTGRLPSADSQNNEHAASASLSTPKKEAPPSSFSSPKSAPSWGDLPKPASHEKKIATPTGKFLSPDVKQHAALIQEGHNLWTEGWDGSKKHFWVYSFNRQENVDMSSYYTYIKTNFGADGWFDVGNSSYALWTDTSEYAPIRDRVLTATIGHPRCHLITYVTLVCATPTPTNFSAQFVADYRNVLLQAAAPVPFNPFAIGHTQNAPGAH